ncbi:hypothetical protein E5P55_00090 [Candidatus Pinguicoccus supinus]|uniref:FAD/NAD(P)-binding domain-containing protein n=1 Tax=Candidatus Pinguicoccus supinus TaxID=2529394 RepID=A0A7T0BRB3_9BACT|nr:hypothetical protein E5P55_00090 [Candidatus Pinguicoccus supinus]
MKKVLIIGSGCSGLTASIYVARASFRPLLIEGYKLGGQLIDTNNIENFPGFPNNISGYCLINKMKKQSLSFGVRFLDSVVLSINFKSYVKKVYLNNRIQFNCFYVLVATGASNRFLNVYGEKKFYCNGISTCATCDGFLTKDKTVVIIGAGDSACEEALFLSKIARKVIVLCRKNRMRASYFLKKKALLNKKVFFI